MMNTIKLIRSVVVRFYFVATGTNAVHLKIFLVKTYFNASTESALRLVLSRVWVDVAINLITFPPSLHEGGAHGLRAILT